jgi:hypothetical protein
MNNKFSSTSDPKGFREDILSFVVKSGKEEGRIKQHPTALDF